MYDFVWLQSKTGSEAMTVSSDGQALWWDIRRLGEPLESLAVRERGAAGARHPLPLAPPAPQRRHVRCGGAVTPNDRSLDARRCAAFLE